LPYPSGIVWAAIGSSPLQNFYMSIPIPFICYCPPVGIISIFVVLQFLIRTKRYLFLQGGMTNVEDQLFLQKLQQQRPNRNQRSFLFSDDDVAYWTYGGIERVRSRLCLAALLHSRGSMEDLQPSSQHEPDNNTTSTLASSSNVWTSTNGSENNLRQKRTLQELLIKSLSISASPRGSWIQYIYDLIIPLAQVEQHPA
jgi:hypothetical protein